MTRRSYDQVCGLARAFEILGERWTALIVRELSAGPQRYSDLLVSLPGIGSGLLARRLKDLEQEGVLRQFILPPPAKVAAYQLSDNGHELAAALLPLALWGAAKVEPSSTAAARAEWVLFSLRARVSPELAQGLNERYEFRIDDVICHLDIRDGTTVVGRGPSPGGFADLVIECDLATFVAIGIGEIDSRSALRDRTLKVTGGREAERHCIEIFGVSRRHGESR